MVIRWTKYSFTINECYGENEVYDKKADVYAYFRQKELHPQDSFFIIKRKTTTLCIDLHKTEEALRKEMNRTTRYQINKGKRDELMLQCIDKPTADDVEAFVEFFNPFAKEKGIKACRIDKLLALKKANNLVLTIVCDQKGRKLAAHAYNTTLNRASMLYSCSGRFANKDIPGLSISRANRYLHWQDIVYFKKQGFHLYDFMGINTDPDDLDGQNINKFKKGFGGDEVIEYEWFIPQNLKGKLLILALKFMWRNRKEVIKPKVSLPI